ncbi:hypothetical protein ACFPM0_06740 [Pseudonocardia sulfidoxydans]|uniref:hypothetical protein n=1 Tax=Pseudonocardia sulfidoxydans TaxID=54011 RepID=UPI00361B43D6
MDHLGLSDRRIAADRRISVPCRRPDDHAGAGSRRSRGVPTFPTPRHAALFPRRAVLFPTGAVLFPTGPGLFPAGAGCR